MSDTVEIIETQTVTVIEKETDLVEFHDGSSEDIIEKDSITTIDKQPEIIEIIGIGPQGPPGTGDVNAENIGIGEGIYKEKVGSILRFKSLMDSGNSHIIITSLDNELTFGLNHPFLIVIFLMSVRIESKEEFQADQDHLKT